MFIVFLSSVFLQATIHRFFNCPSCERLASNPVRAEAKIAEGNFQLVILA
jgi:hypothetical protein